MAKFIKVKKQRFVDFYNKLFFYAADFKEAGISDFLKFYFVIVWCVSLQITVFVLVAQSCCWAVDARTRRGGGSGGGGGGKFWWRYFSRHYFYWNTLKKEEEVRRDIIKKDEKSCMLGDDESDMHVFGLTLLCNGRQMRGKKF